MDHLYTPTLSEHDVTVNVDDALRRHADALRIRSGDHLLAFNGRGLVANCRCERTEKDVAFHVVGQRVYPPPTPICLALGIVDHRERFEFALEKAVELGVTTFIPLLTSYTQYQRSPQARLEAKAQAAMTQSGNPWLPLVTAPRTVDEMLLEASPRSIIILGDAKGPAPSLQATEHQQPVVLFVGPEGGFSEEETTMIKSDSRTRIWSVGAHRLRAETAAIALLSCVVALRG